MNNLPFKNILVLAPHTDDGELGCGATMNLWAKEGKRITYLAGSDCADSLSSGVPSDTLRKECKAATSLLGISDLQFLELKVRRFAEQRQEILDALIAVRERLHPDAVLIPAVHDVHQDHEVISNEALRAFRNTTLLGYELPWNNLKFQPTLFVPLEEEDLQQKEKALASYRSQSHRPYMEAGFMRSLATVRGIQAGCRFAEAFEVYKMIS